MAISIAFEPAPAAETLERAAMRSSSWPTEFEVEKIARKNGSEKHYLNGHANFYLRDCLLVFDCRRTRALRRGHAGRMV